MRVSEIFAVGDCGHGGGRRHRGYCGGCRGCGGCYHSGGFYGGGFSYVYYNGFNHGGFRNYSASRGRGLLGILG